MSAPRKAKAKSEPREQVKTVKAVPVGMNLRHITPKEGTKQHLFFENFFHNTVTSLTGSAGTGKTFIATYKALELINKDRSYRKVVFIRSIVPSRDIGFLKGTSEEKTAPYEALYRKMINDLYACDTAYDQLKSLRKVEFLPSSFLRGQTFSDCIIIVDESQNMSYQELYTIMTRVGENCKVVLTGDTKQDDLTSERFLEVSGYGAVLKILSRVNGCMMIEFGHDDIVRSGFVKDFIIASEGVEVPKAKRGDNNAVRNIISNVASFMKS